MNVKNWKGKTHRASDFYGFIPMMSLQRHLISRTIADSVGEWFLDLKLSGRSPRTVEFYRDNITGLVNYLGPSTQMQSVDPIMIKTYLAETQSTGVYAHHARYRTLRAFFNWALRQGYILVSPLTVTAPRLPQDIQPTFSVSELKAILSACGNVRDKAIIMLFIDTGMRVAEVANMQLGDIELEARLITVRGKGNKQRRVMVSQSTLKAVWQYLRIRPRVNSDNIWVGKGNKPLGTRGVKSLVARLTKKAGITAHKASCHVFRHTFASSFLEAGGQEIELQYLLGHNSLTMVERYSRATKAKRALKAQERLSPVERLGLR